MRATAILIGALALAAAGCDSDDDVLDDKIRAAALEEAEHAYAEGSEGLVAAIRAAADAAAGADGTFTVDTVTDEGLPVTGEVTLTGDPTATVTATISVDRAAEGEPPVEVTLAGGEVLRAGGPFTAGSVTIATEGHVELGGGTGAHTHGGGEVEEELTQPIILDLVLPAIAGDPVVLGYAGGTLELELEEDFPEVPAP